MLSKVEEMNNFLEAFTYKSKYRFLEEGKDDEELKKIAKKRGIKLPAIDLAVFKCEFFYLDQFNTNGCKMERSEVENILDTIVGKQIDINHFRKQICGHWLDAFIEDNKVIAYGAFFKESLSDDYKIMKQMMSDGELFVSMEAWGERDYNEDDKTYSLRNCEMSGGALLLPTEIGGKAPKPAFPGAAVLELSKKYGSTRVLEFASMSAPDKFFHEKGEEKMSDKGKKEKEDSKFNSYEMDAIIRLMWEVECPTCKDKGPNILNIDFENSKVKAKCFKCDTTLMVNLTPQSKVIKKGRKVKNVAIEEKGGEQENKVKDDKKNDLNKSKKVDKKNEDKSSKNNKEELNMDKLLKKYEKSDIEDVIQEIANDTIERELTEKEVREAKNSINKIEEDEVTEDKVKDIVKSFKKEEKKEEKKGSDCVECAKKDGKITELKNDLEKADKKVDEYKDKERQAKEDKNKEIVKSRREELGEKDAKDVKDEDILDDVKFENMKLKKENAKLKKDSGIEDANEKDDDKDLEKGSGDNKKENETDKTRKRIHERAFGGGEEKKEEDSE